MTSDSAPSVSTNTSNLSSSIALTNNYGSVELKNEGEKLLLILPVSTQTEAKVDWSIAWQELKYRLKNAGEQYWQAGKDVHLIAQDQLLDGRQLQTIAEALREVDLRLEWVCTSRRQTAVAAATAGYSVEQQSPTTSLAADDRTLSQSLAEPLYLQTTVRSGIEVRHAGTIVILGDLNPGSSAISAGDIFVWGRLRGVAHAGAQGNRESRIMALQMEPTQLRIADVVARVPKVAAEQFEAEIAYITSEGIRLSKALNFAKTHTFSKEVGGWIASQNQHLIYNN
jgi:septum site-determining protein MinC